MSAPEINQSQALANTTDTGAVEGRDMAAQREQEETTVSVKRKRKFRLFFWRKKKKNTNTAADTEGSDGARESQPTERGHANEKATVHSGLGTEDVAMNRLNDEPTDEGGDAESGDGTRLANQAAQDTSSLLQQQQRVTWSDTIEDFEHMCSICYDVMVRPHKLQPCSHVFCETCLRQLQAVNERSASARRAGAFFVAVLRAGTATHAATVDCPVCRQGILKCELVADLDETIKKRYPKEYKEKKKLLKKEKSSNKHSKLPSSVRLPHRPSTEAGHPARIQPRAANQPPVQPPPRPLPPRRSILLFLLYVSLACLAFIAGLIYLPLIFSSVGFVRLFRKALGLVGGADAREGGGLEFWVRARRDVNTVRAVAFVLFLAALKLWLSVSFCTFLLMMVVSFVVSASGFFAAGKRFFDVIVEVAAYAVPI